MPKPPPTPGRFTTVLTHLGPPVLQTSHIRKLCEVPGPLGSYLTIAARPTTLHDEEPYYLRKLSEGKTPAEARRALKRRLANVIYRRILPDQRRHQPAAA